MKLVYAILWLGLAAGILATTPLVGGLDVPKRGNEKLYPATANEHEKFLRIFNEQDCSRVLAQFLCRGSFFPALRLTLCNGDADSVSLRAEHATRHVMQSSAEKIIREAKIPFEPELAQRITKLVRREIARVTPGAKDQRIIVDGYAYAFGASIADEMVFAKTDSIENWDTIIGMLATLVGMLSELAFAHEADRVAIVGRIDRIVTEIELAQKFDAE